MAGQLVHCCRRRPGSGVATSPAGEAPPPGPRLLLLVAGRSSGGAGAFVGVAGAAVRVAGGGRGGVRLGIGGWVLS